MSLTEYQRVQLREMEFAEVAELFMTEAGEEGVKGISSIASSYRLTATQDDKRWRLAFQTEDGKTGALTLPIPAKLGIFSVDLRDGQGSRERVLIDAGEGACEVVLRLGQETFRIGALESVDALLGIADREHRA